ncbi:MAG: helicase, partial [Actinobacteria bacterium]|nr:helicase [Actinomycetota bacterium]
MTIRENGRASSPVILRTFRYVASVDFRSFFAAHVGPDSDGRVFEDAVRWWLESDPFYAAQVKRAWLWKDWPGRWGADIGIDVVAETHSGELWAVQAKAYAGHVPKREIDSFISASARPEFSFRLLVTSGDSLGRNALTVFEAHSDRAYVCRDGLEESRVDWQQFLDGQKGEVVDRKTLRPHQVEAVRDVIAGFKGSERGQLIMACGSGKTLTSLKIVEESGADLVLALFPSLLLLQQSMHEWLAEAETSFSVIAVCSDERVSRDEDVAVSHTTEIGIPVTTDPEVVAGFLKGSGRRIVFATYQSSGVVAEAQTTSGAVFDLAVCDEAHRCATGTDSVFRTVLDDQQIRCVKRLFMTATPKIYTAAVKTKANEASMIHGRDLDVVSMDDETVFGPVLHRLSLNDAIDQGILTDYQVVVIGCLESEVEEMIANGTLVQSHADGEITDARTVGRSIGLLKAMRTYGMRRAITFHSRVKLASRFAQELPATSRTLPTGDGPESEVWCGHVSGAMPTDARKHILRQLREVSGYGIVSNAQCLKEGVDVPSLDGVAFIDPRSSHVDIVQAVGRAIRTSPDKQIGTILIPVVINEHDDPEQALEGSEFNRIWEVIRSLRSHDDTLAEQIDQIRYQIGKTGDSTDTKLDKLILNLPVKLDIQRFSNAIRLRLIEQTSTSWQQWLGAYEAFYDQKGHGRIPALHKTESGLSLGQWVSNQRKVWDRLSPERTAEL